VVEQNVEESLEYEFEDESNHFIAYADGHPAGTARWRKTSNGIKLERFAVLGTFRNKGIGSALLRTILDHLPSKAYVYLHAQLPAMNLYAKQGFRPEGDLFYEADMPHYKMKLS
jgi:predicted GNAT family N-acyltransferase